MFLEREQLSLEDVPAKNAEQVRPVLSSKSPELKYISKQLIIK